MYYRAAVRRCGVIQDGRSKEFFSARLWNLIALGVDLHEHGTWKYYLEPVSTVTARI